MAEPVTVIYSLNMASGEKKFDPSGDDFEFQGVYQLGPDTGIGLVYSSRRLFRRQGCGFERIWLRFD